MAAELFELYTLFGGGYMKVLAKKRVSALVDALNASLGEVYGPRNSSSSLAVFGRCEGDSINLEVGLTGNSSRDVIAARLRLLAEDRGRGKQKSTPLVLFGLRPCDLRAIDILNKKLDGIEDGTLLGDLASLVVANACLYPDANSFCSALGVKLKSAPGADWLLFNTGEHYLLEVLTSKGEEVADSFDEYFFEADEEQRKRLDLIKMISLNKPHLPDVNAAVRKLASDSQPQLEEVFERCIECGACVQVCPVFIDKKSSLPSSVGDENIERTEKVRIPYVSRLLEALENSSGLDCVGCGRCAQICPVGLGMIEILDSINRVSKEDKKQRRYPFIKEAQWCAPIRHKIVTPAGAFRLLNAGDTVFIASGCAEPRYLAKQFMDNYKKFMNLQVIHLLSMGAISFDDPKLTDHIRLNAFFVGDQSRKAVASGQADYTPVFLSELPGLMRSGRIKVDAAIIQVSPPDRHGYCSLGISVETIRAAVDRANIVIAQVNPRMPRSHGDSSIHVDRIDGVVPFEEPLIEWSPPPIGERNAKIGQYIAQLIEDGSTLQIGIGKIGQALLPFLTEKKDLGLHTQIITDEAVNLIKQGVVTNRLKGLNVSKTVASFAVGTEELYDWLDDNPGVEFYGMDYVADPMVIAQNRNMIAINSAFEVDLSGQVCGDSIGNQFYSGIASMAGFLRGAARSKGGKPIVALPSTAKGGKHSRIRPMLSEGMPVVSTRGDVHYIVTEYGIAYLHGKSMRERALALIEIAHPDHREWLLNEAKRLKYVFEDQELPSLTRHLYPEQWETSISLSDGGEMFIRPIKATDEPALQQLYYSLSDRDVFLRFMGNDRHFGHNRMQALTVVDYEERMAIVATVGPIGNEEILGIARYDINPGSPIAEVAFTVRENLRRLKIGTNLLEHLTVIARSKGVEGFRAEILARNRPMMKLFNTSGAKINSNLEDGMYTLWYRFDDLDSKRNAE